MLVERELGSPAELAATYNNLGTAYQELGRVSEAERLYLKSIATWDSLATPP